MKKVILPFVLIFVCSATSSQTLDLRAGINYAMQLIKVDGITLNPNYRIGGLAAIKLNLEETEKLSAQFEFSYSQMTG
ncbi:MAG TPA: hypothetical protein PK325_15045 [Cyclobacteriaceae bacterium]|nr:hypothetical protein [Cyclobacteriaceae bacterium]HMV08300.1 hypothetical protein [Cyclobacteriaceae bacterium]HMV88423.1 hypothetical protein [Cyclobacteriaceae bacterium]HMX02143.1 hypothetical protein [Cyclobacteriaceae bacterium]HMX49881.1 hypothetical protein [Cyclobacteriaceae bacterium]